ncbi:hypothetical protein IF1G_04658 [Cordyceps javanica]|uniref:Uncharacterized protein n=1 Tax=Cordyceps javanica TaxID=43265 RepID=A0A545V2Y3_9HYPO|nr:hypothetical protein IF1G_04658 [Cordyceps javanica]TQW07367.1 hypothetical protein IF2G_04528 [Cordyceps javanica]
MFPTAARAGTRHPVLVVPGAPNNSKEARQAARACLLHASAARLQLTDGGVSLRARVELGRQGKGRVVRLPVICTVCCRLVLDKHRSTWRSGPVGRRWILTGWPVRSAERMRRGVCGPTQEPGNGLDAGGWWGVDGGGWHGGRWWMVDGW